MQPRCCEKQKVEKNGQRQLFNSLLRQLPAADTLNAEAAPAYELSPRHKLAQLAMTGCLNQTFYADAEMQLAQVLELTRDLEPE